MKILKAFEAFAPTKAAVFAPPNGYVSGGVPTTYTAQRTVGINDAYADVSFVYEIVGDIAQKGSTLPVKVYRHTDEGREEDKNHPVYKLLRRPNPFHNRVEFLEALFANRLIWGEYIIIKVRASGRITELWPVRSDRMREVPDPDTGELLGWLLNPDSSTPRAIPAEDVIFSHRYHPSNDYRGLSPISAMRYQIELGRDAENAGVDFWNSNAMPRGVLQVTRRAGEDSLKRLANQFKGMLTGSGTQYKIPVLEEGMDFKPIQLPPQDAEYIHTSNMTRERVAAAFGYPLATDYPNATPEELHRARFAQGVQPLTVALEEALEHSLMPDFGGDAFPEFQLRHILDASFPQMVDALKTAVLSGIMTPNSAGAKINEAPVEGGDERFVPLNMSPLSVLADPPELITPPEGNTRTRDSADGMGGDEGRTGAHTGENAAPPVDTKARRENYAKIRERRVGNLAKALNNRLRGILKRELSGIRNSKAARTELPGPDEIVRLVTEYNAEMGALLKQYLEQSHEAGIEDVGAVTGGTSGGGSNPSLYDERATRVAAQFADARQAKVLELLGIAQQDGDVRSFMNAVADTYGSTFSTYGEQVARTEVAYAHEAAARQMWAETGAVGLQWNFGGGPCTTGVCEELDGQVVPITEGFAEGPPAHGYCTCFTTGDYGDGTAEAAAVPGPSERELLAAAIKALSEKPASPKRTTRTVQRDEAGHILGYVEETE